MKLFASLQPILIFWLSVNSWGKKIKQKCLAVAVRRLLCFETKTCNKTYVRYDF